MVRFSWLAIVSLSSNLLWAVPASEPNHFKCGNRLERVELTRFDTNYAVTITESAFSSASGMSRFFEYLWREQLTSTYQIDFSIPRQTTIPLVGKSGTCATVSGHPSLIQCELAPIEKRLVRVTDLTHERFATADAVQFTIRTGEASETHLRLDGSGASAETNPSTTVFIQLYGGHFPFVKGGATHTYAFRPDECEAK